MIRFIATTEIKNGPIIRLFKFNGQYYVNIESPYSACEYGPMDNFDDALDCYDENFCSLVRSAS